jgi:hypothetical protein
VLRVNRLLIFVAIVAAAVSGYSLLTHNDSKWFVDYPLPVVQADRLFDIGVVDVNGDNHLDIYSSNHHFRQVLLIANGQGSYRDVVSEWGLDQSKEFPLAELSFVVPDFSNPGLYIYWLGTQLIIRAIQIDGPEMWRGKVGFYDPVDILRSEGFAVEKRDPVAPDSETIIEFTANSVGLLRIRPGGQGLPIRFQVNGAAPLSKIFVGRGRVSPTTHEFTLAMRDRHAMAWADYNSDGVLDLFINRGALGGTLQSHTSEIRESIKDELLVSNGKGRFVDLGASLGLDKRGCSGRHARWVDFDGDGLLDLFVNCYDRENVRGAFPKQLYRQDHNGYLHDVAEDVGLGLPEHQIASFAWFDVENDGDVDVLAFQDEGIFLYRNSGGHFDPEFISPQPSQPAERIGQTKGTAWFYDGKLTIADYDTDGDLDAFSASKRGNLLLINREGSLFTMDPGSIGLPRKSITANWVDYDNDGLVDIHIVPEGLFRQQKNHSFVQAGALEIDPDQYKAAICNWFDVDNDGRLDVLMALSEERDFKHWWELTPKPIGPDSWKVVSYRNIASSDNHWLQVKVGGSNGNPQAIGARVEVSAGDVHQVKEVGHSEGAFFSQGHYRLYFGLGGSKKLDKLTVRWPDGYERVFQDIAADKLINVMRTGDIAVSALSSSNADFTVAKKR